MHRAGRGVEVLVDPVSGTVQGIEYQRYEEPALAPAHRPRGKARVYVLAAHAVENAKLMLASGLGGESPVGQEPDGPPGALRLGRPRPGRRIPRAAVNRGHRRPARRGFPTQHAAFRFDIGNDGWRATTGAPDTTVKDAAVTQRLFGSKLRAQLADRLGRQVRFSVAVEQLPSPANGVSVDPRYRDPFGNPRPVIDYQVGEYTLKGMQAASRVYQQIFRKARINDHTNYDSGPFFPSVVYEGAVFHYHGMGHFSGTHVMGDSPGTIPLSTRTSGPGRTATFSWSVPEASRQWGRRIRR